MGDERGPWIGSAWMVSTEAGPARAPRPRVLLSWGVGLVVLLGALGAAGPAAPVTAALTLPPPDTSAIGATGRVPEAGVPPVPGDLIPPGVPDLGGSGGFGGGGSDSGIPETVLAAYRASETALGRTAPGCRLTWPLVAGIGKVESSHAYGGSVDSAGTTTRPILGPALDGTGGNASISDTDGGALDRDTTWDRAVGPTQFIPTSWSVYGADGNADGREDPDNVYDAALATGRYLCAGGTDLGTASGRHDAVFRYNHSESYVATVLRWADGYASGALPVPDSTGGIPDPSPASDTLASGSPATLAALPQPLPTMPGPAAPPPGLVGGPPAAAPAPGPGPLAAGAPAPGALPSVGGAPSSGRPPSPPVLTGPPAVDWSRGGRTRRRHHHHDPARVHHAHTDDDHARPADHHDPTTPPATTTDRRSHRPLREVAAGRGEGVRRARGELTASAAPGPKAGQVTCTVARSGKALVTAVVATTASAPAPTAPAGVHRAAAGGRVMLAVPASAGIPAPTARTALASLVAAWALTAERAPGGVGPTRRARQVPVDARQRVTTRQRGPQAVRRPGAVCVRFRVRTRATHSRRRQAKANVSRARRPGPGRPRGGERARLEGLREGRGARVLVGEHQLGGRDVLGPRQGERRVERVHAVLRARVVGGGAEVGGHGVVGEGEEGVPEPLGEVDRAAGPCPSSRTASHRPNVGEPARRSTTTSSSAPAVQTTYFACPGGTSA